MILYLEMIDTLKLAYIAEMGGTLLAATIVPWYRKVRICGSTGSSVLLRDHWPGYFQPKECK